MDHRLNSIAPSWTRRLAPDDIVEKHFWAHRDPGFWSNLQLKAWRWNYSYISARESKGLNRPAATTRFNIKFKTAKYIYGEEFQEWNASIIAKAWKSLNQLYKQLKQTRISVWKSWWRHSKFQPQTSKSAKQSHGPADQLWWTKQNPTERTEYTVWKPTHMQTTHTPFITVTSTQCD